MYEYSFYLHAYHGSELEASQAFRELLYIMNYRLVIVKSEEDFTEFRRELKYLGVELKEIERVPYNIPETIV